MVNKVLTEWNENQADGQIYMSLSVAFFKTQRFHVF